MREVTKEKFDKVKQLVDGGMNLSEALKQVKMSAASYYKLNKKKPVKRAKRSPTVITLEEAPNVSTQATMVIIKGDSATLANILRGL